MKGSGLNARTCTGNESPAGSRPDRIALRAKRALAGPEAAAAAWCWRAALSYCHAALVRAMVSRGPVSRGDGSEPLPRAAEVLFLVHAALCALPMGTPFMQLHIRGPGGISQKAQSFLQGTHRSAMALCLTVRACGQGSAQPRRRVGLGVDSAASAICPAITGKSTWRHGTFWVAAR